MPDLAHDSANRVLPPVTLTIDDKQITVPAGTLVVDAARAGGIDIPVFCSHSKLDPLGACRMCLVEFVGPRGSRLDTSCTVRVSEGMVVRTNTELVKAVREANLAFILLNHPLDCPICDKGGECPLQDQTMAYGPGISRFVEPKRHKQKHYPISDLIMLDQERCILCWRCIRYLEEWEDKPQIGLFERGGETIIDVFPGQPVNAKTSGSIIDICPVGALTSRVSRFRYRPWELGKTPSICTLCAVGCNVRLDERVHELRRIVARENPAVNDEWICDKGRFLHQYVDHPERLTKPLVRDAATGELREATWDEAFGAIVERIRDRLDCAGAWAIGGIASTGVSNEAAYLFQKFLRVMVGTNNVDFAMGSAVLANPGGLSSIADIGKSDLIVLVGFDPSEAAPILELHIKRAVLRAGARLLIIGPRRIELARYVADARTKPGAYLPVWPGNEALALSDLAAAAEALRYAETAPRLGRSGGAKAAEEGALPSRQPAGGVRAAVRPLHALTSGKAEGGAGADAADLKAAAALLLAAKSPLFLYGPDVATGERGAAAVAALNNLAALLGQAAKVAYIGDGANSQGLRDMGLLPDALPGHQALGDAAVRERLGKLWGVEPPAGPGLSYHRMLEGGVQMLFVMGDDPGADPVAADALLALNFLVVQDLFLTETARRADVVLPCCSFAEADGTYTNLERRVQRAPQGVQAQGESRPDWAILTELAARWLAQGSTLDSENRVAEGSRASEAPSAAPKVPDWKKKPAKARQGAGPNPAWPPAQRGKAWSYPSARAVLEEIGKAVPFYADLRWEALGEAGAQWSAAGLARLPRRQESTLDSSPRSVPRTGAVSGIAGQNRVITPVPAPPDGSYWLASGPLLWDSRVLMTHAAEEVRRLIPEPFVALNPSDLAATGLPDGAMVSVTSPRGSATLRVRADPAVQPGTAWIPSGLAGRPAELLGAGRGETVAVSISLA